MAHGGGRAKVTPNLAVDGEGTRTLNLTVLQRLDPAVEDILITAAHVTLYDFDTDVNQWVRAPVPLTPSACDSWVKNLAGWALFVCLCIVFYYAEPEGRGGVAICRQEVRLVSFSEA
jgi:hypothetical protein